MLDVVYIGYQLIPSFLRGGSLEAFINVPTKSLRYFVRLISENEVFTGQIYSLEHLLNQKHGLTYNINDREAQILNNEIIWIDEFYFEPFYLWNQSEAFVPDQYFHNESEVFDPVYLHNQSEGVYDSSFIVYVPVSLTFDINFLKALVNKFKLASKKYTVESYLF